MIYRGVINGKAGKTAALPKFSDTLTLSQSRGQIISQPLALPHLKSLRDYAPAAFVIITLTEMFHRKFLDY